MRNDKNIPIKLRSISIENYKGIDSFEMEFPAPKIPSDPDIMIMGSENGLGKTSIIECCALLFAGVSFRRHEFQLNARQSFIDVPDLLIRSGANSAKISGNIVVNDNNDNNNNVKLELQINRDGKVKVKCDKFDMLLSSSRFDSDSDEDDLIIAICGFSPNPVIENSFLLFHSYRKVQEGNPEIGMMIGESRRRRIFPHQRREMPMSKFKIQILKSLMDKADLFEYTHGQESQDTITQLNELVSFYAGGTISKLRPSAESTIDFRVTPTNGENSVTFDGLSSGQKEIISTLFLIWYHTKNNPSIVFIDEPELHLNAQWHRNFVDKLVKLAPQNQYLIATEVPLVFWGYVFVTPCCTKCYLVFLG